MSTKRSRSSAPAPKRRYRGNAAIVPARRRGYLRVRGRASGALVMSPERKYFDTTYSAALVAATTSWASCEVDPATKLTLFCPTSGSGISNRVGRKCNVSTIRVRGCISTTYRGAQSYVNGPIFVRLLLVLDMQTNGAQLNAEDVMNAPGTADALHVGLTHMNLANLGRYRILKDYHVILQPSIAASEGSISTVSYSHNGLRFNISKKFKKPLTVHFNSVDGGTIADIVDHSFHVIAQVSDSSTNAKLNYESRVVYTDA